MSRSSEVVTFLVAMAAATALAFVVIVGARCSDGGAATTTATSTATTVAGSTTATSASATITTDDLVGADLVALLTPEDVQAEGGLQDVRRAGRNPDRRLGGDLNFVGPGGQPLLMVVVQPGESYEDWKADPESFRDELEGLGDAAFIGPAAAVNEEPYLLVFRAEGRTIGLLTYDDEDTEGWSNLLTMNQLQALALVIIGRL